MVSKLFAVNLTYGFWLKSACFVLLYSFYLLLFSLRHYQSNCQNVCVKSSCLFFFFLFSEISRCSMGEQLTIQLCGGRSWNAFMCWPEHRVHVHLATAIWGTAESDPDSTPGVTFISHRSHLYSVVFVIFCSVWRILWCFYFQTMGLEVASGFQPRLISTQPHPARSPVPEFFLQLAPDHHALLQLNDGTVTLLRDFNPVRWIHLNYVHIYLINTQYNCSRVTCTFNFLSFSHTWLLLQILGKRQSLLLCRQKTKRWV